MDGHTPCRGALRRRLSTLSACLAVGLAVFAAGCGGSSNDDSSTTATTSNANLGSRVFAEHCASCHGMNGRTPTGTTGEYGPNFDEVRLTSLAYVDHRIEYGGYGMQSFAGEMTEPERAAVAEYVLRGSGSRVRDVDVPRRDFDHGARLFAQNCSTCHSIAGRAATGRPTWMGTDFGEVKPSYDLVYEKTVNGYYWWMPSFRDTFETEADVKALARYVEKVAGGHPFRNENAATP